MRILRFIRNLTTTSPAGASNTHGIRFPVLGFFKGGNTPHHAKQK